MYHPYVTKIFGLKFSYIHGCESWISVRFAASKKYILLNKTVSNLPNGIDEFDKIVRFDKFT